LIQTAAAATATTANTITATFGFWLANLSFPEITRDQTRTPNGLSKKNLCGLADVRCFTVTQSTGRNNSTKEWPTNLAQRLILKHII